MANGVEIARFWATLGVKVGSSELRKVDNFLNQIEQRFNKFKGKTGGFSLSLTSFKVDQKALSKSLGDALDVASNKVTFQISKFSVNERNLQASLLAAARRLRNTGISVNVGAGNGLGTVARGQRVRQVGSSVADHRSVGGVHTERYFNPRAAERVGYGALDAGLSRFGPVGMAAAVAGGAIYAGNERLNQVQDRVINNDTSRILLGQSVGGSDERKANALEWYKQNSNKYGIAAKEGIADFNTAMVLQRGAGISTREAMSNYDLFSQRFTVRHLAPHQQRAAMRQITQIIGAQKVDTSDLNALIEGGGDPEIKTLLQKAWAQRTGFTGDNIPGAFKGAMRKGEVSSDDLISAYRISSEKNSKELDEAINSVRVSAQRLANDKFWNQFDRDGKEIEEAAKDRIAAERELEEALKPLKTAINQAEVASLSFAASAIRASSKFIGPAWEAMFASKDSKSPGFVPKVDTALSNAGSVIDQIWNNDALAPKDKFNLVLDALSEKSGSMSEDDWRKKIEGYSVKRTEDINVGGVQTINGDVPLITSDMRTPKGNVTQTTTITIGDLNIQSPATSNEDFGLDLQSKLQPLLQNAWTEAQLNYTKTAR